MLKQLAISCITILVAILSSAIWLSDAIGAGWLLFIGEWRLVLLGIAIFSILSIPFFWILYMLLMADMAIMLDETNKINKKRKTAYIGASIAIALIVSLWQTGAVRWFGPHMTESNWIPLFLLCFGICMIPTSKSYPSNGQEMNLGMSIYISSVFIGAILSIFTYLYLTIDLAGLVLSAFFPVLIGRIIVLHSLSNAKLDESDI